MEKCPEAGPAGCECVWECARGRTRLLCQMSQQADAVRLEVVRNTRVYGMYDFAEKVTALAFARRLQQAFQGNGWDTI